MSPSLAGILAAVGGFLIAWVVARRAVTDPPQALRRENHRGIQLGAVLGLPLTAAGLLGVPALLLTGLDRAAPAAVAIAILLLGLGAAGLWDDLRGDERPRGFKGHLGAARRRGLTGGLVKLVTGGVAGLVAVWLLGEGLLHILFGGAVVALSANLINLFDRAPGRAIKVALIGLLPLLVAGPILWRVGLAGLVGGLAAVFPLDLREKGMLGDAGANPLGALVGLGLALTLPVGGVIAAAVLLLGANLASEKWSFSRGIRAVRPLALLDDLGRQKNST